MTERVRPRLGLATPGAPRTCSRTYPGRPDQVPEARAFVAAAVRDCAAADEVILMADEIAANAVLHSNSGQPGGVFTVRVEVCAGHWIQVLVDDGGSPKPPRLRETAQDGAGGIADPGGRGLRIVDELAEAWGVTGGVIGRTVWFRAGWGGS